MTAQDAYVDKTRKNETVDLWHSRLAHVSYLKLKVIMKKQLVRGLPKLEVRIDVVCPGCQYGKAHQLPYNKYVFQAKQPLKLIHSDVLGKFGVSSIGGKNYLLTFTDDFSRYVWAYFLKEKSEMFKKFVEFHK